MMVTTSIVLSVSARRTSNSELPRRFAGLEGQVVLTKAREDRERELLATVAAKYPYLSREAYDALARVVFKNRMSADDAKQLGLELGARADSHLPAQEARESAGILSQALLTLPENDLRTLAGTWRSTERERG